MSFSCTNKIENVLAVEKAKGLETHAFVRDLIG